MASKYIYIYRLTFKKIEFLIYFIDWYGHCNYTQCIPFCAKVQVCHCCISLSQKYEARDMQYYHQNDIMPEFISLVASG